MGVTALLTDDDACVDLSTFYLLGHKSQVYWFSTLCLFPFISFMFLTGLSGRPPFFLLSCSFTVVICLSILWQGLFMLFYGSFHPSVFSLPPREGCNIHIFDYVYVSPCVPL